MAMIERLSGVHPFSVANLLANVTIPSKSFDDLNLFSKLDLTIEAGAKVAIIGPNGIGKTTLARCLIGDLESDAGNVKWAENAKIGYFAQDHSAEFSQRMTLFDWITQWQPPGTDEQLLRATLGRMLFSRDESEKAVNVVSGGEQGRLLFGKLALQQPNVIVMDEPTNHLDMETIEALNLALDNYPGTLIFISHDREFVGSLATRIIELTPDGILDYAGSYDEYLRAPIKRPNRKVA